MSEGLMDWVICGRKIGQARACDWPDTFVMQIYGLVPHPAYTGPSGDCVSVNFESGAIEAYDDDDNVTASADLIDAVKDCPVDRIE